MTSVRDNSLTHYPTRLLAHHHITILPNQPPHHHITKSTHEMNLIRLAAILGATAVIFGAFGAHTLKQYLTPEQLQTFETGVRYQFYHTFAILACGLLFNQNPLKKYNMAAGSFLAGIVCFSGSLYLLSTRTLLGLESWTWLGPVTPIGGLMFIIGWGMLVMKKK